MWSSQSSSQGLQNKHSKSFFIIHMPQCHWMQEVGCCSINHFTGCPVQNSLLVFESKLLPWISICGYRELRVWWKCLLNYIQSSGELLRCFLGQQHFPLSVSKLQVFSWVLYLWRYLYMRLLIDSTYCTPLLSAPVWSHKCHLNPFPNTATFWAWNSLQLFLFQLYPVHTLLAFLLSHVSLWSLIPGVCMNRFLNSTIFDPDPVLNFCHISVKLVRAYVGFKLYARFMLAVEGQTMPNLNKIKQMRTAGDIWSLIELLGAKLTHESGFLNKCE